MADEPSSIDPRPPSWIDKIAQFFSDEPTDTKILLELLRNAEQDRVLDSEALSIIEGALQVSNMQVRDIMIPRSQMVSIKAEATLEDILPQIIASAHSRYPVIGDSPDEILGILLAKDLLPQILAPDNDTFKVTDMLRTTMVVPESKRLNILLREFREKHNHMAIVIDEYGGVAGLVTIEDVLEEIVGEIEDETDTEADRFIHVIADQLFMVNALTPIEEFNTFFESECSDEEFDTIGGLVIHAFGHMPAPHEFTIIDGFKFEVVKADQRKIYSLHVSPSQD